jgi:putative nucleotidyltransferase with HDIG domain
MNQRKRTILFVDDDPMILRGLQRSASEYADEWEPHFALSGKEALAQLASTPVDVLITDMRMPEMDGIALLERVAKEYPSMIRFVLSGNSEFSRMLQSSRLAHQFLAKPCDFEKLHAILEMTCRMRDLLKNPQMIRLTTGMVQLPSIPHLYLQLLEELKSEEPRSKQIGDIIAQDVSMTAKILQLVNSAFFSLPGKVASPQRAVTILGTNTIKALVLGIQVFGEFEAESNRYFSLDNLWRHSILVGQLTQKIAQEAGLATSVLGDCQVAGLLHDIGKLLELRIPNFFQRCKFEFGFVTIDSELKLIGTTHAQLGAYLLGIWGLPEHLVDAVAYHHEPSVLSYEGFNLTTALHIANGLHYLQTIQKPKEYGMAIDIHHLEQIGFFHKLDQWADLCHELMVSSN